MTAWAIFGVTLCSLLATIIPNNWWLMENPFFQCILLNQMNINHQWNSLLFDVSSSVKLSRVILKLRAACMQRPFWIWFPRQSDVMRSGVSARSEPNNENTILITHIQLIFRIESIKIKSIAAVAWTVDRAAWTIMLTRDHSSPSWDDRTAWCWPIRAIRPVDMRKLIAGFI